MLSYRIMGSFPAGWNKSFSITGGVELIVDCFSVISVLAPLGSTRWTWKSLKELSSGSFSQILSSANFTALKFLFGIRSFRPCISTEVRESTLESVTNLLRNSSVSALRCRQRASAKSEERYVISSRPKLSGSIIGFHAVLKVLSSSGSTFSRL